MGKRVGRPDKRKSIRRRRLLVERLGDRRVLASITGEVFEDANQSLQRDAGEATVPSRIVYIDANDNGQLDTGESLVVSEPDGTFEFANLADGTYQLRLFNGTQSQTQTYPVEATVSEDTISITNPGELTVQDGLAITLAADSLVIADPEEGSTDSVPVGNELSKVQALPDGTLLVIGTEAGGETSWIVDPATASVTPIDLSGLDESTPWGDVAIDGSGRGVLVEQAGSGIVRALDASDPDRGLQVTTTSNLVPDDTQVITSDTGSRTIFAWSGSDGLQLQVWSNVTSSFISSPIDVSGTTGLLAFDDASGLLALRTADGGVSVHDVDANFAILHSLNRGTGPVTIDGPRDLLLAVSPEEAMLKVVNLQDGAVIADLAIDLSSVGEVSSIALNDRSDALVVVGAAGITEVALKKATAQQITIEDGQDVDAVLFGVTLSGVNSAPTYSTPPSFVTQEDTPVTLAAPAALDESSDAESDDYVLVQRSQPENGTARILIDGAVAYTPNPDFNGTDSLVVMLHDGRDNTEFTLNFTVDSVADTPSGIDVSIGDVPEAMVLGQPIGDIEVIDGDGIDGADHIIEIDDPRFQVQDGQIILVSGPLDHETEDQIELLISITDTETDETIEEVVAVAISNSNEPITDILPRNAEVTENLTGAVIEFLEVIDEDDQDHTITVDDDRFVVTDGTLALRPDVSIDFETEPVVVVNVTATEIPDGGTLTVPLSITILDAVEQPEKIELSDETVTELMPGDVVGDVIVDGGVPSNRFTASVDDPRFEIVDATLALMDDQFVERSTQSEIEVTITVDDTEGEFDSISEKFVIQVLENETPFHNQDNPYDVDHGGEVSALDALAIINYLNVFGPGPTGQGDPGFCYDVNADGMVTAIDALLVLNELNRVSNGGGTVGSESEGEGERSTGGAEGEDVTNNKVAPLPAPTQEDDRSGDLAEDSSGSNPSTTDDPSQGEFGYDGYDPMREPIEIPEHASRDKFAEQVDETLRLLSDEPS